MSNLYQTDLVFLSINDLPVQMDEAKIDSLLADKKERLTKPVFVELALEIFDDLDDLTAEVYFRGIAFERDGTMSHESFKEFVKASYANDNNYYLKVVFRSFDRDRDRKIDSSELKELVRYSNKKMEDDEVDAEVEKVLGKKQGELTYAHIVKIVRGMDIAANADPYEGKLKGSSSCCLLV